MIQDSEKSVRRIRCTGSAAKQLLFCRSSLFLALLSLTLIQQGCINTMVMVGKVLMGDPTQASGYETATGTNLKKEEKRILIHCTAPASVTAAHDTLTSEVEEEVTRRMKRHELIVIHPDKAAKTFDRLGGTFDPQALAHDMADLDVVFHIRFERFTYREESSPNFYRGNSNGRIVGYEIREDGGKRHAIQVYDQRFSATYPTTYPVAVDQTPQNVFIRRFIDNISDALGASFYDVNRTSLYAN